MSGITEPREPCSESEGEGEAMMCATVPSDFGPTTASAEQESEHRELAEADDERTEQGGLMVQTDSTGDEPLRADEPLIEAARDEPARTGRFLEVVLLLGCLHGLVLPLSAAAFFTSGRWAACGHCNRPLHIWALVHCALHFLQTPLRFVLFRRLRCRSAAGADLERTVHKLIQSPAWRVSTGLATAAYAWFVVGVVWVLNANGCGRCPELYSLVLVMMAAAILKPIVTMSVFRYGVRGAEEQGEQRETPKGASEELLASLPSEEYTLLPEGQCTCVVCLCEFEGGEKLRRLPCGHKFHGPCVDKWLRRNKLCPLCLHDASAPPPGRPGRGSSGAGRAARAAALARALLCRFRSHEGQRV